MSNKPPIEVPQGAIRLNTDTQKLEFYAQDRWHEMATHIHELNGGGRGLMAGDNPTSNEIEYITIPTAGNGIDFGDMTRNSFLGGSGSSRTRAVMMGGDAGPGGRVADIDFVNMLSTGNASDFGDMTKTAGGMGGSSNQTRGIIVHGFGGDPSAAFTNSADFVTIATTGNALDFGDSTQSRIQSSHFASPTRAIQAGGGTPSSVNTIDYYIISTQGNAADFGDTVGGFASHGHGAGGNAVRGVMMGGASYPSLNPNQNNYNVIQYVTMSTLGNALDFGDLTVQNRGQSCGLSNSLRVACAGGATDGSANTVTNAIEYVQIMTTGNTTDFGDMTANTLRSQGCCGDSHGGLT